MAMTCDDVQARVEPYLDGEEPDREALDEHLAGCATCRSAVVLARALQRRLSATVVVPPTLTRSVLVRVRTERWRAEQRFDAVFNVAIGATLLLVGLGVVGTLYLTGLAVVLVDVSRLLGDGVVALSMRSPRLLPALTLGVLLAISGLGAWWWAERRPLF